MDNDNSPNQLSPIRQEPASPQGMTWVEAVQEFFWTSDKTTKYVLLAAAVRFSLFLVKLFPFLASFFIAVNNATGVGVIDDPGLLITVPWVIWSIFRIRKIHRRGNSRKLNV